MNKEELIKVIQPYKYVSFDLFDTLIFRSVKDPTDIYEIVQTEYNKKHNSVINNFKQLRHCAEIQVRNLHPELETNLDEIYEAIPMEPSVKDEFKILEEKIEVENCIENQIMIDILNVCKDEGKKILITTDMYLPRQTIEAILYKLNIRKDRLYLSNEIGITKASGKLFSYVLSDLHISGEQMIHLGDNLISDISRPKEYGIVALERLKSAAKETPYALKKPKSLAEEHAMLFIQNYFDNMNTVTSENRIGFSVLGPVIMDFCHWIHIQKKYQNADKIAFVAREGYFIKQAYECMYPEDKGSTIYIRLNKNLLRLPALYLNPTVKQFMATIPMKESYSFEEIISYFPCEVFSKMDLKVLLGTIMTRTDLLAGKYEKIFQQIFAVANDKMKQQYKMLLEYLEEQDILNNHVLLVNNSINGNGQSMLENILKVTGVEIDLTGIQFVRSRKCKNLLKDRCIGWITDSDMPTYVTMTFNHCALLLEHLMFEPSGTARYFVKTDENIKVFCEDIGDEASNTSTISEIQRHALEFIKEFQNSVYMPMGVRAFYIFLNLFMRPNREDAFLLGNLYDVDVNETKRVSDVIGWKQATMIDKKHLRYINYKMILQDRIKFFFSVVKSAFMLMHKREK